MEEASIKRNIMKIGMICSPGGHFHELFLLRQSWESHDTFWVTLKSVDTVASLTSETVYYGFAPTTRNLFNLIRNFIMAVTVIIKEKPDILISTGGPICIPFFYMGRLLGIKSIYVESLTRIKDLSLTGKLVYPAANVFLVQWEELSRKYKKAQFQGQLML